MFVVVEKQYYGNRLYYTHPHCDLTYVTSGLYSANCMYDNDARGNPRICYYMIYYYDCMHRSESCTLSSSLSKFFIMTGTTTQPSMLISNRTHVSSLKSTLTIRQLSTEDEGSYSCVADRASSLVQLSVEVSRTPSDSPCEYEHEYIIQITILDGSTCLHTNTAVHVYSVLMYIANIKIHAATESIHSVKTDCIQTVTIVIASVISSVITALVVVGMTVAIHIGLYLIKKSLTNGSRQPANEGVVYEAVDDKCDAAIGMKENEAYGKVNVPV